MKILKHISVAALFSFALLLSSFAAISTNKVGISKQEEAAKKIAVLKQKYGNVVGTLNLPKFLLFEKKEETKLQKTLKLGLATNSNFVQINILANSKSRDISGSTNSFSADELLSAAIENYNNRVAVSWLVPPSFVLASPDVRLAFINKVVSQNPARLSSYEGMRYSIHAFGIPTAFSGSEWNLLSTAQTWTNDLNNLDNIYSYLWNFEIQNHTEIYYYGGGGGWELLPMQILLTAILDGNPQKSMAEVMRIKNTIKNLSIAQSKIFLRNSGKSFVEQNGVNPIQTIIQPVINALNAPLCTGLESALSTLGFATTNIDRTALTNDVAAYKDDIFYGRQDANPLVNGSILILLGADGYNQWVNLYNGTTTSVSNVKIKM
jgi:hypothetical protein